MSNDQLPVSGAGDLAKSYWLTFQGLWANPTSRKWIITGALTIIAGGVIFLKPGDKPEIGQTSNVVPIAEAPQPGLSEQAIALNEVSFTQQQLGESRVQYSKRLVEQYQRILVLRAKNYESWANSTARKENLDLATAYYRIRQQKLNELSMITTVDEQKAFFVLSELMALDLAENKSLDFSAVKLNEAIAELNIRSVGVSLSIVQDRFRTHAQQSSDFVQRWGGQALADMNRSAKTPTAPVIEEVTPRE